jgi:hypothetical protein
MAGRNCPASSFVPEFFRSPKAQRAREPYRTKLLPLRNFFPNEHESEKLPFQKPSFSIRVFSRVFAAKFLQYGSLAPLGTAEKSYS